MYKKMFFWLFAGLLVFGCVSPFSVAPPPAINPGNLETSIAQTAEVAQTLTVEAITPSSTPTETPPPTKTATITPTPTNTVIFVYSTSTLIPIYQPSSTGVGGSGGAGSGTSSGSNNTATSDKPYKCQVTSTYPKKAVIAPNTYFNAYWTLLNLGYMAWDVKSVDYLFVSGGHFHKQARFDIPRTVSPGSSVSISVPMQAPKKPGDYGSNWTLKVGNKTFCKMRIEFSVE